MDIREALYTTRAMRRLKSDPVPLDAQARILDAAIRAPSGGNHQNWRFLLVDDPAVKEQLAPMYLDGWERLLQSDYLGERDPDKPLPAVARSADHLARHFAEVPLLLFGFGRGETASSVYPALWSAMLAARAEGIGGTLTTILGLEWDRVRNILGVPGNENWRMYGCITFGYPTGRWGIARRRPVSEVATRNHWSGSLGFDVPEPLWPDSEQATRVDDPPR